ncbi:MAG: type II toxin-antitoxin system RelE/ParE family toxin [Chloroflexota bacterium]|nr:type II toxin-antitoxin system RelE/ParE family toxin [Chloroflexota bacterium]
MNEPIQVIFVPDAIRDIKRLRKRYRRIDEDLEPLITQLEAGETPGDQLQGVDPYIVYKVRLPNRDAGRGKSGGYRVVYYFHAIAMRFLIEIYSKSEKENLDLSALRERLQALDAELKAFAASDSAADTDDNPPPSA